MERCLVTEARDKCKCNDCEDYRNFMDRKELIEELKGYFFDDLKENSK